MAILLDLAHELDHIQQQWMFLNSVPHTKFKVIKHEERELPGFQVPNINAVFHRFYLIPPKGTE
jgi:hypothetical protein